MQKNGSYTSSFYDSLVFSKVRENFGGKIRIMISGSAPIKPEVFEFMKAIMCCPFYEGYGQTENTGAAFISFAEDPICGHVGGIVVTFIFNSRHPCSLNFKISLKCNTQATIKMTREDKLQEVKSGFEGILFSKATTKTKQKQKKLLPQMAG